MRKISFLFSFMMILSIGIQAQTMDELKSMKGDKMAQLGALQAEVDALNAQIDKYPGWKFGGVGVVGFSLLGNNDWYALGTPNASNSSLNIGFSAYANLDEEKYFWRSLLNINVNRSSAFTDKDDDTTQTIALTNGLDLSSLFGYKFAPKWAYSIEGKWLSSILEFDPGDDAADASDDTYSLAFNAPGQLTVSAGVTWLPIDNLVVIIHPLGFQKNFPGEFASSAGAKVGATYSAELIKGISWTSNLSAFIPYGGSGEVTHQSVGGDDIGTVDYSTGDLVTWDWLNGFGLTVWKGVGVNFNLGLRGNQQVADLGRLKQNTLAPTPLPQDQLDLDDNPVQAYWTLGLGYTF